MMKRAPVSPALAEAIARALDSHRWKQVLQATVIGLSLHAAASHSAEPRRAGGEESRFEILAVQGAVSLIWSPDVNVVVQSGDEGVLIVDSGPESRADLTLEQVRKISTKPIRYLVNTGVDPQLTGGNAVLSYAGFTYGGGVNMPSLNNAPIYAHENVLMRMSGRDEKSGTRPPEAWPSDTYYNGTLETYINGDPVQLIHVPNAISDGNSIVFFRRSDVIATGEIYRTDAYPVIDIAKGGTIDGVIDALNVVIDLAIPKHNQEDGTMIVPGTGRIGDESDVVAYRDMVTVIRDRVREMALEGRSLEDVLAADLSADYDGRYGATPGRTRTFLEAVFRTVDKTREPSGLRD